MGKETTWKELSDRKALQQREKSEAVEAMTPEDIAQADEMFKDLVSSPDSTKIKSVGRRTYNYDDDSFE